MAMNIDQARAQISIIKEDMGRAQDLNSALLAVMGRVNDMLAAIDGSGISPERMPSTRALCAEINRIQAEQRGRIFSLLAEGINKL